MKLAIIGSGIAGLTAAYLLSRKHEVTVFEAENRLGGHTATVDVSVGGKDYAIDTGFIVYNDRTYPNFIRLLEELSVPVKKTEMSFSVSAKDAGLEYGGSNLNTLFAQRSNLLRPAFWKMLRDILRFNKEAIHDLESGNLQNNVSLGDYLRQKGYGRDFVSYYLIPMGSAIWSASTEQMEQFPLQFFVRFFKNHGLLSVNNRPQWYVIEGGSREYIAPLSEPFKENIQLNCPVSSIERETDGVRIHSAAGDQYFDGTVLALHSDQALQMLTDPDEAERQILGDIAYQDNDVVLHTDDSVLPRSRRAWSSWNYLLTDNRRDKAVLTYDMNILQGINAAETFCVTLNASKAISEDKILGRYQYSHPVFTQAAVKAQQRWPQINGVKHTWYCGAYWHNGFHEDGVNSAIRVARKLGVSW